MDEDTVPGDDSELPFPCEPNPEDNEVEKLTNPVPQDEEE